MFARATPLPPWSVLGLLLSALWFLLPEAAGAEEPVPAKVRVAITFDDLPASAALPPGYDSERLLSELIATLKAHGVRNATGFVIGARVAEERSGSSALLRWVAAGHEVGNHSYSHHSFEELGDGYFRDVARMALALRPLEARQRMRFFRYPYLQEGRTAAERKLLFSGLSQLGYTLARVSMDFRDWEWADAYNRCLARGASAELATLRASYLQQATAAFSWTLEATEQLLHRPLTHVLLLHANVATAHNLDALLTAYEKLGAEFVPLTEALADPIYTADYRGREGTLLTLLSHEHDRPLPPMPPRPELSTFCQ
ncbi:MAG TPA: polysaccharide deacetylase family protein [Polyangiales bacterium]